MERTPKLRQSGGASFEAVQCDCANITEGAPPLSFLQEPALSEPKGRAAMLPAQLSREAAKDYSPQPALSRVEGAQAVGGEPGRGCDL